MVVCDLFLYLKGQVMAEISMIITRFLKVDVEFPKESFLEGSQGVECPGTHFIKPGRTEGEFQLRSETMQMINESKCVRWLGKHGANLKLNRKK